MQVKMKHWMVGLFIVLALLVPIKVRCGAPGAACAMPPTPGGTAPRYYYEYEPLSVMLLESVTRANLPFYYSSGTETGS